MITFRFADKKLERALLEQATGAKMWGEVVASKSIAHLIAVQSVNSVGEIATSYPWLRDHALKGNMRGTRALNLNDRWRMEYRPDADGHGILIKKVSNHYGD